MTATPEDVLAGRARWCVVHHDRGAGDVLPALASRSVDHIITDPPYRESLYANTRTNAGAAPRLNDQRTAMSFAERSISSLESVLPTIEAHFARLPKRWLVVFHDAESGEIIRSAVPGDVGTDYIRAGAWVKSNPIPQISGDRPGQGFELCSIFHAYPHGRMRWNGGGRAATWVHPSCQGDDRPDHPCPKPVPLMLEIVSDFTDPGEVVLDPFAGAGTTGVACLRLGRRVILIEKSEKYAALARERMEAEEKGLTLRDARAGQLPLLSVPKSEKPDPFLFSSEVPK